MRVGGPRGDSRSLRGICIRGPSAIVQTPLPIGTVNFRFGDRSLPLEKEGQEGFRMDHSDKSAFSKLTFTQVFHCWTRRLTTSRFYACHSEERFGDEESPSTTTVARGGGSRHPSLRSFHCAFAECEASTALKRSARVRFLVARMLLGMTYCVQQAKTWDMLGFQRGGKPAPHRLRHVYRQSRSGSAIRAMRSRRPLASSSSKRLPAPGHRFGPSA